MESQDICSFLNGPPHASATKGLYVITGGFTKNVRYEAERGRIPVTLIDLDDLVKALLEQNEQANRQTQRLVRCANSTGLPEPLGLRLQRELA